MIEMPGDIWTYQPCQYRVITVNNVIRSGKLVMGKGVALQCKLKYPGIDSVFAELIKLRGYRVLVYLPRKLIMFPTKYDWRQKSDMELIEKSAQQLKHICDTNSLCEIVMPRPGCGNGGLDWSDVKPVISSHLDDRFTVLCESTEFNT